MHEHSTKVLLKGLLYMGAANHHNNLQTPPWPGKVISDIFYNTCAKSLTVAHNHREIPW